MQKILVKNGEELINTIYSEDEDCEILVAQVPSNYTTEVIDITNDPEWLLSVCHQNRAKSYPSIGDQLDAAYKARAGDSSMQVEIDAAIAAVKLLYPKP